MKYKNQNRRDTEKKRHRFNRKLTTSDDAVLWDVAWFFFINVYLVLFTRRSGVYIREIQSRMQRK